jgi:hypothetical protein
MSLATNLLEDIDAVLLSKGFVGTFAETALNPSLLNLLTLQAQLYAINSAGSVLIGGELPAFAAPPIVVGQGFKASTLINRSSALSYSANGVIGGLFTLPNIGIANESILLHNLTLFYRTTTIPLGLTALHVYLYSAAPSSFADRATWTMSDADEALIVNADPIILPVVAAGGRLRAAANTLNIEAIMTTNSLVGYVVTPNAFTPNSTTEVLSVTARSWRN